MSLNADKYYIPYTVMSGMIDAKCRLTPLGFVLLAQDLASTHYGSCGLSIPQLHKKGLTWVITKQRFEITEYPLWLDELILSTWAQEPKGPFCFRDYECAYAANGKKAAAQTALAKTNMAVPNTEPGNGQPIFRATSNWMVLDLAGGRPVKPDATIMGELPYCAEQTIPPVFPKIILPESWEVRQSVSATILDIDLNFHVNNTNYVRWILSSVPEHVCKGRLVAVLDTYFVGQALLGDKLVACASSKPAEDGSIVCVHSIVKEADGTEVFRAQTKWQDEASLSRVFV